MELTDGQRSAIKSFILYLFTFIVICFYGVTHALAYDFTNWTGAVVNKFVFKLSNDEYISHTSNESYVWLYRPEVGESENFDIKSVGGELGGFTKEVTGATIFQFALGYTTVNLYDNTTPCQWFKDFSNYSLEYSTDNANSWADFNVSTLSCAQNDGFIVLSYSVTSPGTVNITNLSFSGKGNEGRGNAISTIFTAFNSYPVDSSSNVIINQNNQIIYQNQELIDNQNKTNEKLDGVIDNSNENTDKIINSNKETQELIKDQLNGTCVIKNLFDSDAFLNEILSLNSNNSKYAKYSMQDSTYYYQFAGSSIQNLADLRFMEGQFKENTQYTISAITRQINVTWSSLGFLFKYTDGTSDYLNFPGSQTESNYTFTSAAGKTVAWIAFVSNSGGWTGLRNIQLEEGTSATDYLAYGEMECTNKIAEANETSKGILGKIKDLFNWFTADDDVDTSGLSNTVGWLPDGPVDSILNLPLNMLSSLNVSLSKSCTPLDLTIPFVNKTFQIPCISTLYDQISGFNTLWTWIGTIVSVLMLYTYLLRLYKWVDDTLTFRENNEIDNWGGL